MGLQGKGQATTIQTRRKKSDISYLKTSRAFDIPIHSRVLLAAILSWLATLQASRSSYSLLAFSLSVSLTLSCLRLPLLLSIHLELITVLDYS